MNAEWPDANGQMKAISMSSKVDAGEYLYHYTLTKIDSVPENVVITTSQGGRSETSLTEWVGEGTPADEDYFSDFIDHYMTPTEVTERIEALAEEFPELAEIISLPHQTNGYRRQAQATFGETVDAAFVLTSKSWGPQCRHHDTRLPESRASQVPAVPQEVGSPQPFGRREQSQRPRWRKSLERRRRRYTAAQLTSWLRGTDSSTPDSQPSRRHEKSPSTPCRCQLAVPRRIHVRGHR